MGTVDSYTVLAIPMYKTYREVIFSQQATVERVYTPCPDLNALIPNEHTFARFQALPNVDAKIDTAALQGIM